MRKWIASLLTLSLGSISFGSGLSTTASGEAHPAGGGRGSQAGDVEVGLRAAAIARALLRDRRIKRGHRFFRGRGFRLDIEDAIVIVGNRGERIVFVPLLDQTGQREAYLLHAKRGNKEKVKAFVVSFGRRQAHTKRAGAAMVKVSYSDPQEELDLVVEEAYIIYDYGEEIDPDYGEIVYADEYGALTSSALAAASFRSWVKCTIAGCGPCLACRWAGPLAIKCVLACCGGAAAGCALAELIELLD